MLQTLYSSLFFKLHLVQFIFLRLFKSRSADLSFFSQLVIVKLTLQSFLYGTYQFFLIMFSSCGITLSHDNDNLLENVLATYFWQMI